MKDEDIKEEQEEVVEATDENYINGNIRQVSIEHEMKESFLSYAMSVIVARALPDAKDGLKPVQRRIIYAMHDMGIDYQSKTVKCAKIVGEVMGNYHPHGDSSIYDALVRMAQDFSMGRILVDGQGNFGSIDGDGAAASRYTEAKLSKLSSTLVEDLDEDTVDFIDNYDGSEREPVVLPARIPNLLVNGATGIAVGMATNMPPHNLRECLDGVLAYLDNEDIEPLDLMKYILAPDFPTGGEILGYSGLQQAYLTGRGTIKIRSKTVIEENKKTGKSSIIVTEIPYAVNKTNIIEGIAKVVKEKVIDGIVSLSDHTSNKIGISIVIELKKDVIPQVVLNNLFKHTQLQVSYGINNVALVNGKPETLNLKEILAHYVNFQIERITRRTQFQLKKALDRLHILEALFIVINDIDKVIEIIKSSTSAANAKERLMEYYNFTEIQATAIVELRLRQLTSLERNKIIEEKNELDIKVGYLRVLLESKEEKYKVLRTELETVKSSFTKPNDRKTTINMTDDSNIEDESLIPSEDIIVMLSHKGYIKRMLLDEFKSQNRGGKGVIGITTYDDDYLHDAKFTNTHDLHYFFTSLGRVYKTKGYRIPLGSRTSKGLPVINLFPTMQEGERIISICSVKEDDTEAKLLFVTKKGTIKLTQLEKYKNINKAGIIALALRDGDELYDVKVVKQNQEILLGSSSNKAIRFVLDESIRDLGRKSIGVKGMTIKNDDEIIGFAVVNSEDEKILCLADNGVGKLTTVRDYRLQERGGMGVIAIKTKEGAKLKVLLEVADNQDLLVVTDKGITMRTSISEISTYSRSAQGVKIISLKEGNNISSVTVIPQEKDSSVEEEEDKQEK